MTINKILQSKTNYKTILITTVVLFAIMILLFLSEIFIFWGIFGEGNSASKISEIGYVAFLLDYFPSITISGFLLIKIILKYKKQEYEKLKTNFIVLFILIILSFIRHGVMNLLF